MYPLPDSLRRRNACSCDFETYRLSGERYNQGIDSYLAVLDSSV